MRALGKTNLPAAPKHRRNDMSKDALAKVVQRAISDAAFRRQLNSDPTGALRGFDLSTDELSALRTGDAGRLSTLGIDQRMSKAFAIGGAIASTRMSQSDLTPGGGPSMVDDASGASAKTVIPSDPTRPGGSADLDGGAASGSNTVRVGDDYKFAGRQAPDGSGTGTVRAGDDWKFTDRVSAESGAVRTGDDWKFADRAASQGGVAPVEGSPEASAADINASSGGGRIGTARLDDASGAAGRGTVIHDDPNGFLAANADAGGSVTRANVIHDDPNGFLAANADAAGTTNAPTTAFIDESESYLTKVGYDATAAASGGSTVIHDDPDGFLAANADAGGADASTTTDAEGGPNLNP